MICESRYWKDRLLRIATHIGALKVGPGLTNRRCVQLEKDLLLGFYSVRKLIDAPTEISDATKEALFSVAWHPNLRAVNWRNNHRIDELYDLSATHRERHRIRFIANTVIHSFALAPAVDAAGRLEAILFTSDFDKDKKFYELKVEDIAKIFELVGRDYPRTIHQQRTARTYDEMLEVG